MKTTIVLAIVCLFAFSSCFTQVPLYSQKPKDNGTYSVDYLFEYEGCKVYRFFDNGNYVYFTSCSGDVTSFSNDSLKTVIKNHIKL